MRRVTGLGGILFKAKSDPKQLKEWYKNHLGIVPSEEEGNATLWRWRAYSDPEKVGQTVWGVFNKDTTYLDPGKSEFMINYRVEDLVALLEALKEEGVTIEGEMQEYEFGKFAWIIDPDGNKIELWEPPKGVTSSGGMDAE